MALRSIRLLSSEVSLKLDLGVYDLVRKQTHLLSPKTVPGVANR